MEQGNLAPGEQCMSVCFGLKDPLKLVRGVQLVSGGAKDLNRLEITSPIRVTPIFCISSGFGKGW